MDTVTILQWALVLGSSLILLFISPKAKTASDFFKATVKGKSPNAFMLTGSLVISWIMAKSIANASDLGMNYGIVGGMAYACYYVSFAIAGFVIYQLRKKGYNSIHEFLSSKFGRGALVVFSLLIGFRLFNEVWSNTIVIGLFYGEQGSNSYYLAIVVFTILTLLYALKGGLSSSIFTDVIQMVLFTSLLGIIIYFLTGTENVKPTDFINSGTWRMDMGLNLFFAALVQCFSYPFHDPVLTDRGFISDKKIMLKSYLWAALIGFICITLFSFVGIYAQAVGVVGQSALAVAKTFGMLMLIIINFIMVTSAASTLDSTFSSFSKLISVDLKLGNNLKTGRYAMLGIAVLGTIPVFLNPEVLSATTVSGTMVIGLAPIFIFWKVKVPKISYFLSVFGGITVGILMLLQAFPEAIIFTSGKYADLLWLNLWGTLLCTLLYFAPKWILKND